MTKYVEKCILTKIFLIGEYTMEYCRYSPASPETQDAVLDEFHKKEETVDPKGKKKKN